MARYVIDAPTLLHVLSNDLPIDPNHQLVVPNSIRSEAMELLLHEVRRGERTESSALSLHERMTELKMRLLGDRVSRTNAWKIARQHDWASVRQAEYVAITRLQADALVTIDSDLMAKADGLVPVAPLASLLDRE